MLLTPTAFAAILAEAEAQVGANALKSPGLARTGRELADAGVQRAQADLARIRKTRAELAEAEQRPEQALAHAAEAAGS